MTTFQKLLIVVLSLLTLLIYVLGITWLSSENKQRQFNNCKIWIQSSANWSDESWQILKEKCRPILLDPIF